MNEEISFFKLIGGIYISLKTLFNFNIIKMFLIRLNNVRKKLNH